MPIEIKNLTHVYGEGTPFERRALDNISLDINDGEFIGIIGHTGSGKSTLISYFNGLTKPESGSVFVNGIDIGEKGTDLIAIRRTVGLVFQYPEYQLFEESVEKDIAFGPRNLKLDEAEIASRVRKSMEMVGLDSALSSKSPFELSGGQKRRVAIAGVLAMQPSILVLDEPAAGLDPVGRRDMLDLVKSIHDSGVTVVMVSHSMDDVGRLCDRLIVLDHGKIAFTGTPGEVFAHADALHAIGLDIPEYAKLANILRETGWNIEEGIYRIEDVKKAILAQIG
ncbi:MAG: energy-coupling factor transporter ATPase [Clostridia bacterium]|nr:energy-coupling factor transporter ATPase [Clostridia bacterium]